MKQSFFIYIAEINFLGNNLKIKVISCYSTKIIKQSSQKVKIKLYLRSFEIYFLNRINISSFGLFTKFALIYSIIMI